MISFSQAEVRWRKPLLCQKYLAPSSGEKSHVHIFQYTKRLFLLLHLVRIYAIWLISLQNICHRSLTDSFGIYLRKQIKDPLI